MSLKIDVEKLSELLTKKSDFYLSKGAKFGMSDLGSYMLYLGLSSVVLEIRNSIKESAVEE